MVATDLPRSGPEADGADEFHRRLAISVRAIEAEISMSPTVAAQPSLRVAQSFNGSGELSIGPYYARVLTALALPQDARILDLGCGFGRVAMALARIVGPDVRYVGLDPTEVGITWARENITPRYPHFTFEKVNIQSKPYNPQGDVNGADFRFPFADGSLDLVYMISVLTHVDLPTVLTYIREAARVLKPDGRLVTTIFLLDDEVERHLAAGHGRFGRMHAHGPSRVQNRSNPELAIAHPRKIVEDALRDAGFVGSRIIPGHWSGRPPDNPMDFQDLVIASRTAFAPGWSGVHPTEIVDQPTARDLAICARAARWLGGQKATIDTFLPWSSAVALNVFWWQSCGLHLETRGGEVLALDGRPWSAFDLDAMRPDSAAKGGYSAMDAAGLIRALVQNARAGGRRDLWDLLLTATDFGLTVQAAVAAGHRLVLRTGNDAVRIPAEIPAFQP